MTKLSKRTRLRITFATNVLPMWALAIGAFSPGISLAGEIVQPSQGPSRSIERPTTLKGGVSEYDLAVAQHAEAGYVPTRPEFHVVDKGDTLWDICRDYFRDPYLWPKVWSYNEQITNAHWIFPGDRVRLSDPYSRPQEALEAAPALQYSRSDYQPPRSELGQILNQFAYIDAGTLDKEMEIVGGADASVMMADMDTAYINYHPSNPPIPGERLAVYRVQDAVHDWKPSRRDRRSRGERKGDKLGYLVEIVGEVLVKRVARKSAEVEIVDSIRPIERGQRVGELRHRFVKVGREPATTTDTGAIIEVIRDSHMAGKHQFVVSNIGSAKGAVQGNVLEIVHKGDDYSQNHVYRIPYEEGHPRRVLGEVLVLQVQENVSLGVIVSARREIERGDPLELRVPSMSETDQRGPGGAPSASASGQVDRERGAASADGSAEFQLGGN